MMVTEDELTKLRFELTNAECLALDAQVEVARLEGKLKDTQCINAAELQQELADARVALSVRADELDEFKKKLAEAERIAAEKGALANSQLADAQAAFQAKTDELKKLSDKLAEAERIVADETARADRAALDAALLRDLNLNLTGVIQVLKQTVVTAPATPVSAPAASPAPASASTSRDVQNFMPWYKKGDAWKIAGGVALMLLLVIGIVKLISDMPDSVDAVTGEKSVPASEVKKPVLPALVVSKAEPPVVPSIQPPTPSRSGSCPYASLTACADDMVRRVGGVPSDPSIRKHGIYSCQRIGCQ